MTQSFQQRRTPSFYTLMNEMAKGSTSRVRVAQPGKVLSYDASTDPPTATVQPILHDSFSDNTTQRLPPIANVPVLFPMGGGFRITHPYQAGDMVLLLVVDRSIDEFKSSGGDNIAPASKRRFDISDAVIIGGVAPGNGSTGAEAGKLKIEKGDTKIEMSDAGITITEGTTGVAISLSGGFVNIEKNGVELLSLIDSLMTQVTTLSASVTATILGPQPLSNGLAVAGAVAGLQSQLLTLRGP